MGGDRGTENIFEKGTMNVEDFAAATFAEHGDSGEVAASPRRWGCGVVRWANIVTS